MKVIIDRIEDGIATVELENGKIINVPYELFADCREGDIVYILKNEEETETKKKEMQNHLKSIFEN